MPWIAIGIIIFLALLLLGIIISGYIYVAVTEKYPKGKSCLLNSTCPCMELNK